MSYAAPIDISHLRKPNDVQTDKNKTFVLDIGGSLAKLAYDARYSYTRAIPKQYQSSADSNIEHQDHEGVRMCFVKFETRMLDSCLKFIKENLLTKTTEKLHIKVTGGGAHKYCDLIRKELNVEIDKLDEMECLIRGLVFLLHNIPDEVFTFDKRASPPRSYVPSMMVNQFPFLLVNIGSGVSIIKVDSPTEYSRVGGSSVGGGTFWGISSKLTEGKYTFDELLDLATKGDHRNVDMLVRDIYGGNYESHGLPADVIASSFGMVAWNPEAERKPEDMVKSVLITVANNIGQLSYLYARMHNLSTIFFGGLFIRGHAMTMGAISYAIKFWSGDKMRAMFLRHEGYVGAVGAFIKAMEEREPDLCQSSWVENYVARSPPELTEALSKHLLHPTSARVLLANSKPEPESLELEQVIGDTLVPFPLLADIAEYEPDSWIIHHDKDARTYWLDRLQEMIPEYKQRAIASQPRALRVSQRADSFAESFGQFLQERREFPSEHGLFTVRGLLDALHHFLREYGFNDVFYLEKQTENNAALQSLPARLAALDKFEGRERTLQVALGLLAGNVFDWGSSESAKLFSNVASNAGSLEAFQLATNRIKPRPWLADSFDAFAEYVENEETRPKCVLIFCDNSGADVVLGVLPFVVHCLSWPGCKVLLTANTGPAFNDITVDDLVVVMRQAGRSVPSLAQAVEENRVRVVGNGQSSACIDLRMVSSGLVGLVESEGVDLIVLEGMGRAVQTNYHAKFAVNCLKVAVIKNSWVASRLGCELFDVIFDFKQPEMQSN